MDISKLMEINNDLERFLMEQRVDFVPNKSTIIKYTKLPPYSNNEKQWKKSRRSPPRIRVVTSVNDSAKASPRSLKSITPTQYVAPIATPKTHRKIAIISEVDESDNHPKFSSRISRSCNTTSRSRRHSPNEISSKTERSPSPKGRAGKDKWTPPTTNSAYTPRTVRLPLLDEGLPTPTASLPIRCHLHSPAAGYPLDVIGPPCYGASHAALTDHNEKRQPIAKVNNNDANRRVAVDQKSKSPNRAKSPFNLPSRIKSETIQSKTLKVSQNNTNRGYIINKLQQNITITESEDQLSLVKSTRHIPSRKQSPSHKQSPSRKQSPSPHRKLSVKEKETPKSGIPRPLNVIHVPLETKPPTRTIKEKKSLQVTKNTKETYTITDKLQKSKSVGPDTDMHSAFESKTLCNAVCQTADIQDSLNVPNISLIKNSSLQPVESHISRKSLNSECRSLPNIYITPCDEERLLRSYVIGRATLTYMTKQSIDFHLYNEKSDLKTSHVSQFQYPLSVLSIYKNELKTKNSNANKTDRIDVKSKASHSYKYDKSQDNLSPFSIDKLVKPSDVIRTIQVNSDLLQNHFISEQFQKELNFIDSFFESLQYLEKSSLCDGFTEWGKDGNTLNIKEKDYEKFLSKLSNCSESEDQNTIASKSLCLLNLLIRDEQRRVRNLLFVLKMREDALKDFTKSQIIWLENKKRRDSTDISTLKKKQRGALLRLQHECGEMQRMRKGLLALSEKRKSVLLKTKKSIEQKHFDFDKLLGDKKKLKNSDSPMLKRNQAPINCSDVLSSETDDPNQNLSKHAKILIPIPETNSETTDLTLDTADIISSIKTIPEHFVVVDGKYLNILFQNLSLPQIFNAGKQYEVNEEALQNILKTMNSQTEFNDSDMLSKFLEQLPKEKSANNGCKSSSPSTARSLLDELDQFYNSDNKNDDSQLLDYDDFDNNKLYDLSGTDTDQQGSTTEAIGKCKSTIISGTQLKIMDSAKKKSVEDESVVQTVEGSETLDKFSMAVQVGSYMELSGPLPVPPGATKDSSDDNNEWAFMSSTSVRSTPDSYSGKHSHSSLEEADNLIAVTEPALVCTEAERLRQQQLAIEKEIKALVEQQSLLGVVREIPDKPPPPYTPPAEIRTPSPLKFTPQAVDEITVRTCLLTTANSETCTKSDSDQFDEFVLDYCEEFKNGLKVERSECPWDACNLVPPKSDLDLAGLVQKTYTELKDVLRIPPPPTFPGMSRPRSDQNFEDNNVILSEWRRRENEWTSLHVDEVAVKNRIFENIFQKILTETVDEYKRIHAT